MTRITDASKNGAAVTSIQPSHCDYSETPSSCTPDVISLDLSGAVKLYIDKARALWSNDGATAL